MTDELRERVAEAINEVDAHPLLSVRMKRADRAIAICREHYEAEIARLKDGRTHIWQIAFAGRQRVEQLEDLANAKDAEIARLTRERDDAVEALEPFSQASDRYSQTIGGTYPITKDTEGRLQVRHLRHARTICRALRKEEGDA